MSFKDKAREIKAHGEATRGNYNPAANSLPVRLYKRWAEIRPSKAPERENFCHYWRVVLIWAPLWIVGNALDNFAEKHLFNKRGVIAGIALLTLFVLVVGGRTAIEAILGIGSALYLIASLIIGVVAGNVYDKPDWSESDWKFVYWFFPSFVPFFIVKTVRKVWHNRTYEQQQTFSKWGMRVLMVIAGLAIASLLVAFAIADFLVFLGVLGGALGIVALVYGVSFVSDYFKMKRKQEEDAKRKAREDFLASLTTEQYIAQLNAEIEAELAIIEGRAKRKAEKGPGRVEKFFTTIGDFFNLIFQAVRVNKWKICPIVEIPTDRV